MSARNIVSLCVLLLIALSAVPVHALEVAEEVIATAVEGRRPMGVGENFPAMVGTLYCYSRIVGAEEETAISHRWFYGEREMAAVELPVGSADWRTWSSKTLLPRWKGAWRVDIVDASGKVLKSVPFRLE